MRMFHPFRRLLAAAMLAVCFVMPVAALAEPEAAITEGTVYQLPAAQLEQAMDTGESENVVFSADGMQLAQGETLGAYVSLPIRMTEFTKITLSLGYDVPEGASLPTVALSVYHTAEQSWGEWIDLPEDDTAKRTKGAESTVLLRFRITLQREDASGQSPVFKTLIVTAGEHFFTQTNLIMVFIMVSALFILVYRRKLTRKASPK
ncbi:MAG: hypothetical protein PHY64_06245 [Eubacteriales bacterium]|nr:hypothetical protein [Eubacteriales bacterium]